MEIYNQKDWIDWKNMAREQYALENPLITEDVGTPSWMKKKVHGGLVFLLGTFLVANFVAFGGTTLAQLDTEKPAYQVEQGMMKGFQTLTGGEEGLLERSFYKGFKFLIFDSTPLGRGLSYRIMDEISQ